MRILLFPFTEEGWLHLPPWCLDSLLILAAIPPLAFPVKRVWTCFENLTKCFLKNIFSPTLLCPCYLSKVLLVGCSVELEAANLHPKWRCHCSVIPQPFLFQPHSSTPLQALPSRVLLALFGIHSQFSLSNRREVITLQPRLSFYCKVLSKIVIPSICTTQRVLHTLWLSIQAPQQSTPWKSECSSCRNHI